jgi:hypothetical protein
MRQSSGPAVVVHSLAQARVALSVAAQAGVPVVAWDDHEWGCSHRMSDPAVVLGKLI